MSHSVHNHKDEHAFIFACIGVNSYVFAYICILHNHASMYV